jgi:hypothetical protein
MIRWLACFLALVLSQPGCTFIGAGIGAAIPRHETVDPHDMKPGSDVRLHLDSGEYVDGRYVTTGGEYDGVILSDASVHTMGAGSAYLDEVSHYAVVPEESITGAESNGSYWATGLLVGLLVDVALVAAAVAVMSSFEGPDIN